MVVVVRMNQDGEVVDEEEKDGENGRGGHASGENSNRKEEEEEEGEEGTDEAVTTTREISLSERLRAYGASSWMCRRVTLGDVTLVPGIGGVAVIPELDLSSRQRNRLRASRRALASPPPTSSVLFATAPATSSSSLQATQGARGTDEVREETYDDGTPGRRRRGSDWLAKLKASLDKDFGGGASFDDDDDGGDEDGGALSDGSMDDDHDDGTREDKDREYDDDINAALAAYEFGHTPEWLMASSASANAEADTMEREPYSLAASAPWYSVHRRPQRIRDEVRRDIAATLERDALWQSKTQPARTITRERVEELAKPRKREDPGRFQDQLIVRGKRDVTCTARRRQQGTGGIITVPSSASVSASPSPSSQWSTAAAAAAAAAGGADPRMASWRVHKEERERAKSMREEEEKLEAKRRARMLHTSLSRNASQNLSSYIETRKRQLERAKEKRSGVDGTFNTLKQGVSCWDLETLRQQGIRVIR